MNIAIIGGGIGGLATAIALQQRGVRANIYEAAPEITAVGAGIMLPPNAMEVLGRLQLADAVRADGFLLDSGEVRDVRDGLLQRFELSGRVDRADMTTLAIHRARLQRILVSQLPSESVHVGRRCVGVEDTPVGARIRFADGSELCADVVIGADGLRSIVREYVRPGMPLRYAGQTSHRAVARFSLPNDALRSGTELWAPGRRFGFGAIATDEVYWFTAMDTEAGQREDPLHLHARLTALYADFPAPVPALIAATEPADIIHTDLFDFVPMRPWHRGRVVLIGDAAHATTPNLGQGGAQAIEDAWFLADRLANCADSRAAFTEFEARRVEKTRRIVERSRQMGHLGHLRNPLARRLRNIALRLVPESVGRRQMESIFRLNF
ncbi:MAG: FAD-dependent monooxygenase [Gemmatimonadota bacterium]